jgi:thiol:disulfide interchange protein
VADGTAVVPSDQGVFAAGDVPLTSTAPAATPAVANAWADKIKPKRTDIAEGSLWWYLVNAFLGGIVLNFMPCVLPVIAIKVLGFANQAGESRGRVLVLNIAYSVGVIAVFVLLASLATLPGLISGWDSAIIGINTLTGMSIPTGNLDWGQLFQLPQFNVAMASIVFAMGLSLLGVFEIPVPGMVGNVQNHREGPMGAFLTGILATLLATPCTGPFMGAALSWSVTQSPAVIYAVWSTIGLGMAFPYILCGIFPKAVAWIPKPGMWMVRLKEFAGFVLMGTVVWIVSYLNITYVLPLLVILLGIAMSLWMISNLYNYSSTSRRKWTVRAFSAAIAVAAVYLASTTIFDVADDRARQNAEDYIARSRLNIDVPAAPANRAELEWVRFTGESLDSALSDGRTVFIDFTANWCNICKVNEAVVLNTEDTKQFFEELGVVAMKADMTNYSPELEEWKTKFGGSGLPHYVVISARDATNPRVFSGPISTDQVQKEIRQVGPSRGFERNAASADAAVMK